MNKVILMGRLTAEPALNVSTSGKEYCKFVIAVDRKYIVNGEKKTDFINCVAWNNVAKNLHSYFEKGKMVALEGNIQVQNWTDSNNQKKTKVVIVAESIFFCS